MWTKYINVSVQVAELQFRKSELEDVVFGLKLAGSDSRMIEKLEAVIQSMLGDDLG